MLSYISKENFLAVMKDEQINEFDVKNGRLFNEYIIRPLEYDGYLGNKIRNDLKYSISLEKLNELLIFLNYNERNKLHGFFKIDKNLKNNDPRDHLYKRELKN